MKTFLWFDPNGFIYLVSTHRIEFEWGVILFHKGSLSAFLKAAYKRGHSCLGEL